MSEDLIRRFAVFMRAEPISGLPTTHQQMALQSRKRESSVVQRDLGLSEEEAYLALQG